MLFYYHMDINLQRVEPLNFNALCSYSKPSALKFPFTFLRPIVKVKGLSLMENRVECLLMLELKKTVAGAIVTSRSYSNSTSSQFSFEFLYRPLENLEPFDKSVSRKTVSKFLALAIPCCIYNYSFI